MELECHFHFLKAAREAFRPFPTHPVTKGETASARLSSSARKTQGIMRVGARTTVDESLSATDIPIRKSNPWDDGFEDCVHHFIVNTTLRHKENQTLLTPKIQPLFHSLSPLIFCRTWPSYGAWKFGHLDEAVPSQEFQPRIIS